MGISASGFLGDAKKNMFQTTVKYDDFFAWMERGVLLKKGIPMIDNRPMDLEGIWGYHISDPIGWYTRNGSTVNSSHIADDWRTNYLLKKVAWIAWIQNLKETTVKR